MAITTVAASKAVKSGTVILPCICEHQFQDKTYGKNRRVHNFQASGHSAHCTVCGSLHSTSKGSKAASKPAKAVKKKK